MTHGFPLDWFTVLASTTPRWILLAIVMPFVLSLAVRVPVIPVRVRAVALHVTLLVAVSLAHAMLDTWAVTFTSPMVAQMFGLIPRLTRSWYNTVPMVATMFAAVHMAAWGMREARERQLRTLRASQLEGQLHSARLAALRAQLQPHFLYNTLNSIAALVAGLQPQRAVAAIEQLGELLHASLRDDGREEITVDEEIAIVERYLALQGMRFGDRLRYGCDVAPDVADCLVPILLLQPLVENAVVHGLDAGQESLYVRVSAGAVRDGIEITVENDGRSLRRGVTHTNGTQDGPGSGHGLGVATTRARLITAHGDRASLTINERAQGGVCARIFIPRTRVVQFAASVEPVLAGAR